MLDLTTLNNLKKSSGVRIELADVNYHVKINSKLEQILHNINLCIQTQEMVAIMGESGAGKRY